MAKLLFIPLYLAALAVPFFNQTGPELFGFPFFYWYQILFVPVGGALIYIVFKLEDHGSNGQ